MKVPLKVMLVDDEIMALDNMAALIDWERSGFALVARETNPQKALDSFIKLRPQIVFVDIMMPVMNGLELSRKLLSFNIPVKIVILTSYKDFNYAKTAIEVGVANYLVKHELSRKTLASELVRLKKELSDDEKKEEIIRNRLLRSLVDNTISGSLKNKKILNRYIGFEIGRLLFLFCKIDTPFKVIGEPETSTSKKIENLVDEIKSSGIGRNSDVFGINSIEAVVVIYLEKNVSVGSIEKTVTNIFNKVQAQISKQGETISMYPIVRENKMDEVLGIYSSAERAFDYSIFQGRGKIIPEDTGTVIENDNDVNTADYLHGFAKMLHDLDNNGIELFLDTLFDQLADKPWNFLRLRNTCDYLTAILHDFIIRNHLPVLEVIESECFLHVNLNGLFHVKDILKWYKTIYGCVITKAKERKLKQYSHKVNLAIDFIHENYRDDWAVEDISGMLNISEVYLRKIFKEETGSTIVNYLTDLRIQKAIDLLKTGSYKIFEIAEMVGYHSSQYFSKVFKKHTGMNPADYF